MAKRDAKRCLDLLWEAVKEPLREEFEKFFREAHPTLEKYGIKVDEPEEASGRSGHILWRGWEVKLRHGRPVLVKVEAFVQIEDSEEAKATVSILASVLEAWGWQDPMFLHLSHPIGCPLDPEKFPGYIEWGHLRSRLLEDLDLEPELLIKILKDRFGELGPKAWTP